MAAELRELTNWNVLLRNVRKSKFFPFSQGLHCLTSCEQVPRRDLFPEICTENCQGMPCSKKRPLAGMISWERNGGRLQRLDNLALQEDVDILVYDIDNVNAGALAEHTSEQ